MTALALLLSGCVPPAQVPTAPEMQDRRAGAKAIVVVHSRSGNTARFGRELARTLGADYTRLAVPPGSGDGFFSTPNRHATVSYMPRPVDLRPYDVIFLGSPLWYWRPSAFIYAFVRDHDLSNKRVILFYTYEGGASGALEKEWSDLVVARGGRVVDIIAVNRKKPVGKDVEKLARELAQERGATVWGPAAVDRRD